MTFPLKEWHDAPNESTPVDTVSLNDAEQRLGAYTDAHELHWRAPVANFAALPEGEEDGDVRVTLDTGNIWRWDEGSKTWKLAGAEAGHWRAPVAKVANLPAEGNEDGDVRLVLEGALLYYWKEAGEEWILLDIEATEFWRPPVEKFSELAAKKGTDIQGTVRLAEDTGKAYWLNGAEEWLVVNEDDDTAAFSRIVTSQEPFEGAELKLLTTPDEVTVTLPEGGGFLRIVAAFTLTTPPGENAKLAEVAIHIDGEPVIGSNSGQPWFVKREAGEEERIVGASSSTTGFEIWTAAEETNGEYLGSGLDYFFPAGEHTVTLVARQEPVGEAEAKGVKIKDRTLRVEVL